MIPLPGILIAYLTFPGVIIHEVAHQFFCQIFRIPVFKVVYFQFATPVGYVIHERAEKPFCNLLISVGPFIINTILGALILLPVSIQLFKLGDANNILTYLQGWLGISVLMHAFPSTGDAQGLITGILKNKEVNLFAKVIAAPIIGLIYVGAVGSIIWLDLGYAIGVGMLLPNLF